MEEILSVINEIWKPIINYEDLYEISNYGRINSFNYRGRDSIKKIKEIIKAIKNNESMYLILDKFNIGKSKFFDIKNHPEKYLNNQKILKSIKHSGDRSCGHQKIRLCKNHKFQDFYIHRLVLETFIGPCPSGMECRHLDGNSKNNSLDNLRWGTKLENENDKKLHGTDQKTILSWAKLDWIKIGEIKKLLREGTLSQGKIGKLYNVSGATICMINTGKIWKE